MERKLGFIFDHSKCIICNACVDACNKAYGGLNWRSLVVMPYEDTKTALSIACNHCDNPVCMNVCPANAMAKNEMGIVRIIEDNCIGCGFCTWACPYEALKMTPSGIMSKCHLCYNRIGSGLPYCVEACPTGALTFGWIEKGDANVNYLAPENITEPRFVIKRPEKAETIKVETLHQKKEENYIGLLAFTIASEIALGYSIFKLPYWNLVGLILPLVSLLLSVNHAKRFDRFYRVIYNLKTSWLSREVLFSSISVLFYLISFFNQLFYYPAVIFLGLGVLSSIMIYILKARPSWYNPDTPVSFIGSIFTTSLPLLFYLTHEISIIAALIVVLGVEIFTGYKKSRTRVILNAVSIVLSLLSIPLPFIILTDEIVNLVSEVSHRIQFYQKVIYYGLPKV
ncbi:4Fe-4S ferredoxin [Sulfolobus acidocaldarius SUSAZ]|nr:4Fe-4S ferredoxin [Sulfolobus acidocaldarius SUSAZ]